MKQLLPVLLLIGITSSSYAMDHHIIPSNNEDRVPTNFRRRNPRRETIIETLRTPDSSNNEIKHAAITPIYNDSLNSSFSPHRSRQSLRKSASPQIRRLLFGRAASPFKIYREDSFNQKRKDQYKLEQQQKTRAIIENFTFAPFVVEVMEELNKAAGESFYFHHQLLNKYEQLTALIIKSKKYQKDSVEAKSLRMINKTLNEKIVSIEDKHFDTFYDSHQNSCFDKIAVEIQEIEDQLTTFLTEKQFLQEITKRYAKANERQMLEDLKTLKFVIDGNLKKVGREILALPVPEIKQDRSNIEELKPYAAFFNSLIERKKKDPRFLARMEIPTAAIVKKRADVETDLLDPNLLRIRN